MPLPEDFWKCAENPKASRIRPALPYWPIALRALRRLKNQKQRKRASAQKRQCKNTKQPILKSLPKQLLRLNAQFHSCKSPAAAKPAGVLLLPETNDDQW